MGDHSAIRCRRGLASVCEIEPDRRWRRSNPRWMCPRFNADRWRGISRSARRAVRCRTFVSSPVPVRNHETTLRVLPITDGNRSYVEWSSRFEIDPEYETQLVDLMNRNFLAGLRNLAKKSSRDGPASS